MNAPRTYDDPPVDAGILKAIARGTALGAKPRDLSDIPAARAQLRHEQSWWREQQAALAEVRDDVISVCGREAATKAITTAGRICARCYTPAPRSCGDAGVVGAAAIS